jgi:V8-like Glu-specific endopeptidase
MTTARPGWVTRNELQNEFAISALQRQKRDAGEASSPQSSSHTGSRQSRETIFSTNPYLAGAVVGITLLGRGIAGLIGEGLLSSSTTDSVSSERASPARTTLAELLGKSPKTPITPANDADLADQWMKTASAPPNSSQQTDHAGAPTSVLNDGSDDVVIEDREAPQITRPVVYDLPKPEAIIGGRETEPSEGGHLAYIYIKGFACTGTALSSNYVLTAAHCIMDMKDNNRNFKYRDDISVYTGSPVKNKMTSKSAIEAAYFPECALTQGFTCDYLLLKTSDPMQVTPLKMITTRVTNEITSHVNNKRSSSPIAEVQGFGLKGSHPNVVSDRANSANVTIEYITYHKLKTRPLAGTVDETCYGDSGGPLIYRNSKGSWLAGVISTGSEACGEADGYTKHVNVNNIREKIQEVMRNESDAQKNNMIALKETNPNSCVQETSRRDHAYLWIFSSRRIVTYTNQCKDKVALIFSVPDEVKEERVFLSPDERRVFYISGPVETKLEYADYIS